MKCPFLPPSCQKSTFSRPPPSSPQASALRRQTAVCSQRVMWGVIKAWFDPVILDGAHPGLRKATLTTGVASRGRFLPPARSSRRSGCRSETLSISPEPRWRVRAGNRVLICPRSKEKARLESCDCLLTTAHLALALALALCLQHH